MNATRAARPFPSLTAPLDALAAADLVGDLDLIAEDAEGDDVQHLQAARDAVTCAESVETLADFAANLRDALDTLARVGEASQVSAELSRLLARC